MGLEGVQALAKKEGLAFLDLKFVDLLGGWQHFTVPLSKLDEDSAREGFGFDGSSIKGFQDIHESDLVLVPELESTFADPFSSGTLGMIGTIQDPVAGKNYPKDPRSIARKAEAFLQESGIAEKAFFGPEPEFFLFDSIRFSQNEFSGYYFVDSAEASWNSGKKENGKNLGYKTKFKQGYFPVMPTDSLQGIRNEIVAILIQMGVDIECHHHEVATAGQCEIDMRFDSLTRMADNVMKYKYIVKNVARQHGKTATFMPKPLFNDNGSGMHCHQSLWNGNKNLFAGNDYAGLSEMALYYIGGILHHAPALCALVAPTTNSYKRLVPGFEAPVNLAYSKRNRSAAVRIPMYSNSVSSKRIEFRTPDPSCNPYLAFSAMLLAGIDGIRSKIHPGESVDADVYELMKTNGHSLKSVPGSLSESLEALEEDHSFLLEGNVFSKELLDSWIELKQKFEIEPLLLRPHPWEFQLYYDT